MSIKFDNNDVRVLLFFSFLNNNKKRNIDKVERKKETIKICLWGICFFRVFFFPFARPNKVMLLSFFFFHNFFFLARWFVFMAAPASAASF